MKRALSSLLLPLMVLAFSASGCKSQCRSYCDFIIDCSPQQLVDSGYTSCEWDGDIADVKTSCLDTCADGIDTLSSSAQRDWRDCQYCVEAELDDSCDANEWGAAVFGPCDLDCDNTGTEDYNDYFYSSFTDTMTCQGGNAGCTDTCSDAFDGWCDDGGPGSDFALCGLGTDCADCGTR